MMKTFISIFSILSLLIFGSCRHNDNVSVDDHEDTAGHATEEHPAEAVEHTEMTLSKGSFRLVHKTSGQILVDEKDEIKIIASNTGTITFYDDFLFPGVKTATGEKLFRITGGNLAENNPDVDLLRIKSDYDKAASEWERIKLLYPKQLVTAEQYQESKNEYEKTKAEYDAYMGAGSANGGIITSPATGYINNIYIREGQMVRAGDEIAEVIIQHNLILKADIAPSDLAFLDMIEGANFSTGYVDNVYSTSELNGRKISSGRSTGANSYFIPVFFRIDYRDELIPGTFADIWLLGPELEDVLTVPNAAIMEEYGKYYVFVEDEDGDILKRYFVPGHTDGKSTLVVSGLEEGETIVSSGVYQVKMSLMGGEPPAHSHNH